MLIYYMIIILFLYYYDYQVTAARGGRSGVCIDIFFGRGCRCFCLRSKHTQKEQIKSKIKNTNRNKQKQKAKTKTNNRKTKKLKRWVRNDVVLITSIFPYAHRGILKFSIIHRGPLFQNHAPHSYCGLFRIQKIV